MEIAIQNVLYLPSQWEIKKTTSGALKSLQLQGVRNNVKYPAKEEKAKQARSISPYQPPHQL